MIDWSEIPRSPQIRIEVPRLSIIKPKADGTLDFISPFPCPYNYGSIAEIYSDDGDPLDALVLGPRLAKGSVLSVPVRAVYGFIDKGRDDPKLICKQSPLTHADRLGVIAFFTLYARCKRLLYRFRRTEGETKSLGFQKIQGY